MLKDNFDGESKFKNSNANKYLIENEVEYELENFLNTLKTKSNIDLNLKYLNNSLSSTIYSSVNNELYILLKSSDSTKKIENYSLVTFSFETSSIKSKKNLKFILDDVPKEISIMTVHEMQLHPGNENQMCFFSPEYLAFIKDLKSETEEKGEETLEMNIIHTGGLKRESVGESQALRYKVFKFSNFDNHFGVLFTNNSFGLYSIDSKVSQVLINKISKDIEIKNFSFGSVIEFGWSNFSIFFLDAEGGIHYACPVFPNQFKISQSYLKSMLGFVRNLKSHQGRSTEEEHFKNEKILFHLDKCSMAEPEKVKGDQSFVAEETKLVRIQEYLKNFNKNINLNTITTIDKRKPADLILFEDSIKSSHIEYHNIYIVKMHPLTILRVGMKKGGSKDSRLLFFIDILICHDDITPIRKSVTTKNGYLIESVIFKYNFDSNSNPSRAKILNNISMDNLIFGRNYYSSKKFSIYVNILNDIFEVNFPYLKSLSESYSLYAGGKDLKLNISARIKNILTFNYSKSTINKGYYGIDKIPGSFILITANSGTNKFIVKEVKYLDEIRDNDTIDAEEEILKYSNSRSIIEDKNYNFQKLEENLRKIYSGSSVLNQRELGNINFERLEILANKVLSSSAVASASSAKDNPILYKQIVLDDQNLKRFNLENLDDYLQIQVDGIAKVYENILNVRSAQMIEKIRALNEINEKLNVDYLPKLKKEIEDDRSKINKMVDSIKSKNKMIDQKIISIKDKIKLVLYKDKNIVKKYHSIKGYFEDKHREYQNLQKSSEEVKDELLRAIKETKTHLILKETLNPQLIDKDLLPKQKNFHSNLVSLQGKLKQNVARMDNILGILKNSKVEK